MPDFDYSEHRPAPGDNILAQINAEANKENEARLEVERLTEELAEAQRNLQDIREHRLPQLMEAAEVTNLTTRDGLVVDIQEKIRGSIPKLNEHKAFAWLDENKHADLIKNMFVIQFNKEDKDWADKFARDLDKRKRKLDYTVKANVHPQTLAAFVAEQLEKGVAFPMELFGVYRQRTAKVTLPKAKVAKARRAKGLKAESEPGF